MSLVPISASNAALADLVNDTMEFATASRADGTVTTYSFGWAAFNRFCDEHGLDALPTKPSSVALFLTHLAREGKSVSTINNALCAIKYWHSRTRHPFDTADPIVTEVMAGIRRKLGVAKRQADAILPEHLAKLVATCDTSTAGKRDRAILLVGFAGAFRRSEITSLMVEDVEFVREGVVLFLRRSKTDQEGHGAEVAIPYASDKALCPVRALWDWIQAAKLVEGAVFRRISRTGTVGGGELSEESIRQILAKAVEAAGLEGQFSPHSLRAGFCTAAALSGAKLERVAAQARHKAIQTTLGYVRVADRFQQHAGAGVL